MSTTTERPDELIEILEGDLLSRNDKINRWGNVISSFQNIPGLVGFWPMSSVQRSTGNAFDLTSQGRTLTYNGNPTYNIYNDFMPYIDLDGTGDFLSRADETDLDISGTETIYNSSVRGLTIGSWVFPDALPGGGPTLGISGKWLSAGNQRSYLMLFNSTDFPQVNVSSDGIAAIIQVSSVVATINNWFFIVGRFTPSTNLDIFVNGTWTRNTTSIPASLFNSTASFELGAFNSGLLNLNGRIGFSFLSANTLSDALINALFQQSRVLFGV